MSTPQGFKDEADPRGLEIFSRIRQTVAGNFSLAGFDEMRTPAVEFSSRIGGHMLEIGGMFSFKDAKDKQVSLRYDHTAPLARYVEANRGSLQMPFKPWREGWVWRNEMNVRAGRFREFYQMDADVVGTANAEADASLIRLLLRIFSGLGLDVTVRWSSRQFVDQMLDNVGIAEPERRRAVMRALDKTDRQGSDAVRAELRKIVPDGANIRIRERWRTLSDGTIQNAADLLLEFANAGHNHDAPFGAYQDLAMLGVATDGAATDAMRRANPGSAGRLVLDPALVRGMEYYTGLVFEATVDGYADFGAVAGGGRYDNLIKGVPCSGMSVGVSRLAAVMQAMDGDDAGIVGQPGPVLVFVMDDADGVKTGDMLAKLMDAGIRAEAWCGDSAKLGRALAYADRRNSPAAVIQGADEAGRGTVQIKDLALGRKISLSHDVADNAQWRSERPGQFEVPAGDMVERVQQIIDVR